MSNRDALTVMAFDYGRKRIGVAVGQTVSRTATALEILPVKNGNPPWAHLTELIAEWRPNLFVVGMPQHDDGSASHLSAEIERFSRRLSGRYDVAVEFADERLSSFEAAAENPTAPDALDDVAARLILLTWFEGTSTTAANR